VAWADRRVLQLVGKGTRSAHRISHFVGSHSTS
jgi:hypothetical protein